MEMKKMNILSRFYATGYSLTMGLLLAATTSYTYAKSITIETESAPIRVTAITEGLRNPWGLDFLPDGRMIVTERGGEMRIVEADGTKGPALEGVPEVAARGQGGLLDVTVAPDFSSSKRVYFSFSEDDKNGKATSTAGFCGGLSGDKLASVTRVLTQQPKCESTAHFGSRIVFAPGGNLFITRGE